jgi:dihydropteroate synthase
MITIGSGSATVRGLPDIGRTRVLGVLNVTPDSFSDGGAWYDPDRAVERGLALAQAGADIVDVGGESTRPGADRVAAAEELRRVVPVVGALAAAGVPVSVDTLRAPVAEAALAAGAMMVNDVSGGLADEALPRVVAAAGVPYVVMHWRGHSADMQDRASYRDVVTEVAGELRTRLDAVLAAGVAAEQVILDPGIGFAKTSEHNWTLLAALPVLVAIGRPVLVGASRKAFLGQLLGSGQEEPRPVGEREAATTAVTALAARAGAWGVRVHEAGPSADAVRVVAALMAAGR